MASQVTFDEWFATECKGLSFEARRLMQISWNAALTNGDQHFFVEPLHPLPPVLLLTHRSKQTTKRKSP